MTVDALQVCPLLPRLRQPRQRPFVVVQRVEAKQGLRKVRHRQSWQCRQVRGGGLVVCYMIVDSCVTVVASYGGRATRSGHPAELSSGEKEEGNDQEKGSSGKAC